MAIVTNGNGYRASVYNPLTKKHERSRTFSRRKDAVKAEAAMIERIEAGREMSGDLRMQTAFELWYDTVYRNVAERTRNAYLYNWKSYCAPLHGMKVQKVQAVDIVRWRSGLEKTYSAETVNKALSLVSMVLAFCRDVLRVISMSPTEHVPRCKVKAAARPTWDEEQIKGFLEYIEDSFYYAPLALICTTGMRPGECCGLMESDMTLAGSLTLRQGRNAYGNITEMKTERSHRTIALSDGMAAVMRSYIKEKHRAGCLRQELFVSKDFAPMRPDWLSRVFHSLVKKYNAEHDVQLPAIRLYDIRHSFATNCLMNGAKSKLVSEVMGNSVNTMEHHYAHLRETMHKELVASYAAKVL